VRVFLDTNILVSAYATRGLCADVLRLILTEHELLTGEVVLNELERILSTKVRLPSPLVQETISFLRQYHVEPKPRDLLPVSVADADDAWVLASAVAAEADVLMTGDPHLLNVANEVKALRIINPRGFWEMHRRV
jgi:putative PIN family toxin of toxin-antitoxin system